MSSNVVGSKMSGTTAGNTAAIKVACGVAGAIGVAVIAFFIVYSLVLARKRADDHLARQLVQASGQAKPAAITSASSSGRRIVVFKAEWCSHCKALAPVIQLLQAQGVPIESIEAPVAYTQEWFAKNGVTGFPTICELHNDRVVHIFTGRRTADNIAAYVKERTSKWVL